MKIIHIWLDPLKLEMLKGFGHTSTLLIVRRINMLKHFSSTRVRVN